MTASRRASLRGVGKVGSGPSRCGAQGRRRDASGRGPLGRTRKTLRSRPLASRHRRKRVVRAARHGDENRKQSLRRWEPGATLVQQLVSVFPTHGTRQIFHHHHPSPRRHEPRSAWHRGRLRTRARQHLPLTSAPTTSSPVAACPPTNPAKATSAAPSSRPTSWTAWSPSPASFLQHADSRLPLVPREKQKRRRQKRLP